MAGILSKKGHNVKDESKDADVFIFNMCSVKGPSVRDCLKEIKENLLK